MDRPVRQIFPIDPEQEGIKISPFSAFADHRNIVLLGDPGSGKSHLFRECAAATTGAFMIAREFLNVPLAPNHSVLFIDALDEKRAGRGDHDTIDRTVQKLFATSPAKVRISCREHDWLGDTDFAAFRPYFDRHEGVVVLGLLPLTISEQSAILAAQGVNEPLQFLQQATDRGLAETLSNPQNLIMLAKAVGSGTWPATRRGLFELYTELLLTEHNQARAHAGDGVFIPSELRDAAGGICAARLIADVEGVSLAEQGTDPDFPSYRTLSHLDPGRTRAALGRRVFAATAAAECVDYSHRTTAEYLGASWLAKQVQAGLPLGRVQSVLGLEGHPASALRGLHAWLAVLLPEHSNVLIEADPYGVLAYGDAASLSPASRQRLLDALGRLSEIDPWFRQENRSSWTLGLLSTADMVGAFRAVLRSTEANFALKSIVIGAMMVGSPLPELQEDLLGVMRNGGAAYALRVDACRACIRLGDAAKDAVARSYRDGLGQDEPSLRLRAEILSKLYGERFGPTDAAILLADALNSPHTARTIGTLWSVNNAIPLLDIPSVLDALASTDRRSRGVSRRNAAEVVNVIDRLLLRLLNEPANDVAPDVLMRWLELRRSIQGSAGSVKSAEIKQALRQRPAVLLSMLDAGLLAMDATSNPWAVFAALRESTLGAIDSDDLLACVMRHVLEAEQHSAKEAILYECAFAFSYGASSLAVDSHDQLWELAESRPHLQEIRTRAIVCPIPDRQSDFSREMEERKVERQKNRQATIVEFQQASAAIRAGAHLGWLAWLAALYFGLPDDVEETKTPNGRLIWFLGSQNAEIATEGFLALLQRSDLPSLELVAEMSASERHYEWWRALIAGLDERWRRTPELIAFGDDLLRLALAIELTVPTLEEDDEASLRMGHAWKAAVFEQRPELARDAYLSIVRVALRRRAKNVWGLRELLSDRAFASYRSEITIGLLRDFPDAAPHRLQDWLSAALADAALGAVLLSLARRVIGGDVIVCSDQFDMWLIAAYVMEPQEFQASVEERAAIRPHVVWLFRELTRDDRHESSDTQRQLSIAQLEFVIRTVGGQFANTARPNFWGGDQNPWDAADYVRELVTQISASTSPEATAALTRLAAVSDLSSYRDHLLHALANQRVRRRDFEYCQPDWLSTVTTLANGAPANVADLHALLLAHLADINSRLKTTNTDLHKRFWNEDAFGRTTTPKPEESCRDVLVDLVRGRLSPLGVIVEPEGHMVADRRADVSIALPGRKVLVELKRDYHANVWTAAISQLDRFYTIDHEATGYGVYGVFWFGASPERSAPMPPKGADRPRTAAQLRAMLESMIPSDHQHRLGVIVFDVSGAD